VHSRAQAWYGRRTWHWRDWPDKVLLDLLVFIDADLTQWGPHFVTGLLGPLLADPGVQLVKGFQERSPAAGQPAVRPASRDGARR
jgi:hypothetical protein